MHASHDDLDPSTARACVLLSAHTGPDFTAGAAAALLDMGVGTARDLIAVLAGAGLLIETTPDRWHVSRAAREGAEGLATISDVAGELTAATGRVIDYYLRGSAAADLLINPGRLRIAATFGLPALNRPAHPSPAAALAWCDVELANLLQAQRTAADHGRHALAWQFADTLWGWCTHRHRYADWASLCEIAIESAHLCGDARAEVMAAVRLASCQLAAADVPTAATIARRAIATAWASGDRAGEGSAHEHAAMCALATSDYATAIEHCTRGLACWRRITGHRRPEALLERLLGRAYAGLGDRQQAAVHLDTALGIFEDLGERYHAARTRYYIATTRLASSPDSEHASEAITLLEHARPLLRAEDHPSSLADLLISLADAYLRAGNPSLASACLQEATALHLQLNLPPAHPARARASAVASQLAAASNQPPHRATPGNQAP
jgi:tetratricopeptide (TPR) repeat protein